MKKLTAIVATVLLLIGLLTFGVSADGFTFREESRERQDSALIVTWNHAEGEAEIEDILIGGKSQAFTMDAENVITVDLSALTAGEYAVVYEYVVGADQKSATAAPLVIEGEAAVTLSAAIGDDGYVTITAKNASGMPIADYSLTLTIGTMSGLTGKTDAQGTYKSYLAVEPGDTVVYEGLSTSKNGVVYAAVAAASLSRPAPTTTTTETEATTTTTVETTTTTEETTTTTEEETTTAATTTTTTEEENEDANASVAEPQANATVAGAGTTAHKDDKVVLNIATDEGLLDLFGYEYEEFAKKAEFLLSEDDYNGLVGRNSTNLLMLNVLTAKEAASEKDIRTALGGVSAFAIYGENQRQWMTFDLSFLVMDRQGNVVPVSAVPLDSTYVVELPVPKSMKDCTQLAITMKDKDGYVSPQLVTVKNGTFKLEINSLEAYTLIGFTLDENNRAGGVSKWVVLLYIAGILLLVGAGLILYFFVLRKPAKKNEEKAPEIVTAPQDENDIFSGRTDMPPQDGE